RDFESAGADASDMMQIFGTEAGPAMISLLNRGGDELEEFETQLQNSAGTAEEMAEIKMEGLQGQLKELQSAGEGLMLAIADSGLLETVTALASKVTEWVQELASANPQLIKWAVIIGAVVAAIGPLLIFVGMMITAVGQIGAVLKLLVPIFKAAALAKMLFSAALWASPITWIVLGIIALIAIIVLLIVYWDEVAAACAAAWEWIKDACAAAWDWIKSTAASIWDGIKAFFADTWDSIKSTVVSVWDAIAGFFSGIWNSITSTVTGAVNGVRDFISNGFNTARNLAIAAFTAMRDRVRSTIQGLLGFVRGIPGNIRSALGNLGSLLTGAGRNVIQGLINGIKSMIGSVGSTMSNVASTIRSYLPFSPAEVGPMSGNGAPEVSGARIAETLGEGILSELAAIDRAADALMAPLDARVSGMRDMTRHIPSNVNTAVRHSGGRSDTITLDVTGADGEFKKLIRRMVRTDGRGDVQTAFGQ
ncbi:phage tail tape measure protein, partial [Nocardiopsis exhalans]